MPDKRSREEEMQTSFSLSVNDFNLMNKLDARLSMCVFGGKNVWNTNNLCLCMRIKMWVLTSISTKWICFIERKIWNWRCRQQVGAV